jgi:hypothetical protein
VTSSRASFPHLLINGASLDYPVSSTDLTVILDGYLADCVCGSQLRPIPSSWLVVLDNSVLASPMAMATTLNSLKTTSRVRWHHNFDNMLHKAQTTTVLRAHCPVATMAPVSRLAVLKAHLSVSNKVVPNYLQAFNNKVVPNYLQAFNNKVLPKVVHKVPLARTSTLQALDTIQPSPTL